MGLEQVRQDTGRGLMTILAVGLSLLSAVILAGIGVALPVSVLGIILGTRQDPAWLTPVCGAVALLLWPWVLGQVDLRGLLSDRTALSKKAGEGRGAPGNDRG